MKAKFCSQFDMTDMGALEHFLNVYVTRSRKCIQLDQCVYTAKVLEMFATLLGALTKFGGSHYPGMLWIGLQEWELELSDPEQIYVDNFPYRSFLGALLHLSINTSPDSVCDMGLLSRFGSKPTLTTSPHHLPDAACTWNCV